MPNDFRPRWHPFLAADERTPGVWTLVDSMGRDYGARRAVAEWQGAWPFIPVLIHDDWEFDEIVDLIHEEIPADAWRALVRTWLKLD